ncbi:MAG: response regulator [Polyangiaceae bacterium]|nr:response regulator [Polyangiaceae bacterium]MBK8942880.1 response regulator [Polyangiaceae bacterium]
MESQTFALDPSRWGGARVLLAEDDDLTRDALCCVLRRDGHRVIVARDGLELLGLVAVDLVIPREPPPFDLIVCDVVLPGVSGLEILAGLHSAGSVTPFIVMTAYGTPEMKQAALRDGAAFFLEKPFELQDFRAAVSTLLEPQWVRDSARGALTA